MSYQERLAAEGSANPGPGPKPVAAWCSSSWNSLTTQVPSALFLCCDTELGSDSHPVNPQLCAVWGLQRLLQSSGPEWRAWRPAWHRALSLSLLSVSPLSVSVSYTHTHTHTRNEAVQKLCLHQSWCVTAGVGYTCLCRFLVPLLYPGPPGVNRAGSPPRTDRTAGSTFTRWTSCLLSWFGDRCSLLTIQGCLRT